MTIKKISALTILLAFALGEQVYSGPGETKPIHKGQSGNGSSNSGDPYEIDVVTFPDKQKLSEAIKLAENKLLNSNLPESLISSTISEMKSLASKNKYLYIESITSWPTSSNFTLDDMKKIVGYGALTESIAGSAIYFSKRALDYDLESFAKLLLHEVFHHTLRYPLAKDEELVELLAQQIIIGQVQPELLSAISKGIYIREGVTRVSQIFEYWDRIPEANGKIGSKAVEGCSIRIRKDDTLGMKLCLEGASVGVFGMNMERNLNAENAWNLPLDVVSDALGLEIRRVVGGPVIVVMRDAYTGHKAIRQMVIDLGYEDPLKRWPNEFCKKKPRFFGGCRDADRILMKDLFQ